MRSALLLVLLATAGLAGCTSHPAWSPPVPEAFVAVYEYQTQSLGHGFVNVTLSDAAPALDADFVQRPAYRLAWALPRVEARPGKSVPADPASILFDGTLHPVRSDNCDLDGERHVCDGTVVRWTTRPHDPWGFASPLFVPQGDEDRVDHANGTVDIEDRRYEPGRLVPSFIGDLEHPTWHDWYRLASYQSRGPLSPIDAWPAPPAPLANATHDYEFIAEENEDVLGLGWTLNDAIAHLHKDERAAAIFDHGGCVTEVFLAHFTFPLTRQAGIPLGQQQLTTLYVTLLDQDGHGTLWFMSRGYGVDPSSLSLDGFSGPGDPVEWTDQPSISCDEVRHAPPPRMGLVPFLDRAKPWASTTRTGNFSLQVTTLTFASMMADPELGLDYQFYQYNGDDQPASGVMLDAQAARLRQVVSQEPPT